MDPRYGIDEIYEVFSYENRWLGCQTTELGVIKAKADLGIIPQLAYDRISEALTNSLIDVEKIKDIENELGHDYNSFLKERRDALRKYLSERGITDLEINELSSMIHGDGMTTYDGQEAMFAMTLLKSVNVVKKHYQKLEETLANMAMRYRYTPMYVRTHGQGAKLGTFGAVCLTYIKALRISLDTFEEASKKLAYSKIAGATGNWGCGLTPEIEEYALANLGFKPLRGVGQIVHRGLYAPTGNALELLVLTLNKIAIDIRLGARSGLPIVREGVGKKHTDSSVMPNKRNTISDERIEGMARLAEGYADAIRKGIVTWEGRSIEGSAVERVAWPDIFHVTVYSLQLMNKILSKLEVYPDNMLREIADSCGCYAADEANSVIRRLGLPYGLTAENSYRIVQLAALNAEEMLIVEGHLRENPPQSFWEADQLLLKLPPREVPISIQHIILAGNLKVSPKLAPTEEDVKKWNGILRHIFGNNTNINLWNQIFLPSHIFRHEKTLYEEILGCSKEDSSLLSQGGFIRVK